MRAFVIMFDALLALSFLLITMVILLALNFHPTAPSGVYLKQLTLDVLAVGEETGRAGLFAEGNSSAMREIMEATPELVCMQISISDSGGNEIATVSKASCGEHGGELQSAARTFVYHKELYMLKAQAWYRKGWT